MTPTQTKTGDWALAGDGCVVVFVKSGGRAVLDLPEAEFRVTQMVPQTGQRGDDTVVQGKDATKLTAAVDGDVVFLLQTDEKDLKFDLGMVPEASPIQLDGATLLSATKDFDRGPFDGFVPNYVDRQRNAIAIDAAQFPGKKSAAQVQYEGNAGSFDVALLTMTETDGESTYELYVNDKAVGTFQNPPAKKDYQSIMHLFHQVRLQTGDTIRVVFDAASNEKKKERGGFGYSRGRWTGIAVGKPGAIKKAVRSAPATVPTSEFVFNYDPTDAKKVHKQTNGIVVVEAEEYDAVDRETARKWYLTTVDTTPDVKPDPDDNHAAGAVGKAYLEILPDTRTNHGDPLVHGVSFSNTPGQCNVLYYPVIFTEPGRYYVWVRMCCTGSEDNGLHVGIDGTWPASGARLQFTGKHGQWQWDSRQRTNKVHTGVLGQIWLDVEEPGLHTIMFSMREDGFEFDRFLLTKEKAPMESKNSDPGPPASPKVD
jgi:hypothetical protein